MSSIFFLIPVAISTWYGSRRDGIITACISAFAWLLVDSNSRIYINPVAPYWNALVRLGMFLVAEELLDQLRIRLGIEKTLSRTDNLTGLLNARGFFEQAEILFGLAARHNRPITLAYLDLDNFKKVNDELGHSEGDKVLRAVGDTIQSSLRRQTWRDDWAAMNSGSYCPSRMKREQDPYLIRSGRLCCWNRKKTTGPPVSASGSLLSPLPRRAWLMQSRSLIH